MKTRIKIVFLLMMPAICLAQPSRRDSLKTALKTARTDSVRFNSLMDLGWEYSETNRDTGLYFHDQALRLAKKNAHLLDQAWALWGKGYELTHLGKFPEALVCFQEGLQLAEDPANEKNCWYDGTVAKFVKEPSPHTVRIAALAYLHHNLGHLVGATGNIEEQITHYRISKALASGIGSNLLIGQDDLTLGNVYLKLNQLDSALMFEQSAERIMIAPGAYRKYLGYVYEALGQVYLKKQNKALAIKYFRKAISADLYQKNLSGVAYDYSDLTDYYLGQKQIDSSLYYATRELNVLQFMRSKDLDQAFEQLYQSYKLAGKTDSAYKYQGLALKAKDSVFKATTKSLTDFQKLSFNAQIHAQQLEKEKEAIQTKIRTYVLLAGIGVLMLLAGVFYRNNRQKQKANVLLNRQKEEIEGQAREAQIEAALERVRSRTMAMQHSDELAETAYILFKQFKDLGENPDQATIGIINEVEGVIEYWVTLYGSQANRVFKFPIDEPNVTGKIYKAWKKHEKSLVIDLSGKALHDFSKFRESMGGAGYNPDEKRRIINVAFFSKGLINVQSTVERSVESLRLLERFANVFESTYTRFLDLKKAEAQVREAQIEAALEKVRSRSLAMHKSDELRDVVKVVFERLQDLSFGIDGAAFIVTPGDVTKEVNIWIGDNHAEYPSCFRTPFFDAPVITDIYDAIDSGQDFFSKTYAVNEKNPWFEYAFKHTDYKYLPEELRSWILAQENLTQCFALAKNSGVGIHFHNRRPLSENEIDILKRFSKVFEQSYIRFLDLQRAEIQARESQIEAALERVRSRTMGMQKSGELAEVIQLIYEQLVGLNFNINNANFVTEFPASGDLNIWMASSTGTYPAMIIVPYFDHPIFNMAMAALDSGADHFVTKLTFTEKNQWLDHYFKTASPLPDIPRELLDRLYNAPGYYTYGVIFKTVVLSITNYEGYAYTEAEQAVILRFGKVFEQTYTRFLDLQKAEAQAREAVKQASLDRVRGEIASMRTTKDLERIIPLVWSELTILGIPFIRCGVFIVDEVAELIHTHLSTPDGKAIAAFDLPFDADGIGRDVLPAWRKKQMAAIHWSAKEFAANTKNLVSQGAIKSRGKYVTERPDTTLDLHFFPFLQGMLYVGNIEQLNVDAKDLVQSLAEAFSTAYARYEDFNKLEVAKQQVDKTLIDLKSAQTQLIQNEKMASLGELTAGIAHEIQNPLNFVNNFSEVNAELIEEMKKEIENGDLDEILALALDIEQNSKKINMHGKRADGIVKGMLQHSKSGSTARELTQINALADEYMRLAYHGLRAKDKAFNVEMVTHFDPELPKIMAIGQDIGRVMLNLFNNAFYAVSKKQKTAESAYEPEVSVTTYTEKDQVVIKVRDNGIGIPDNIKEKIMQPFFTTKPTGEGTGLGLSLTYDMVVKGHAGKIEVNTQQGVFTEFKITLPIS